MSVRLRDLLATPDNHMVAKVIWPKVDLAAVLPSGEGSLDVRLVLHFLLLSAVAYGEPYLKLAIVLRLYSG